MTALPRTSLSFLEGKAVAYYAGMDDKVAVGETTPFPVQLSLQDHVRCLKVLSLIVDHVVIPPTFLAHYMRSENNSNLFLRSLEDAFGDHAMLTSVYSSMADTKDFVEYKKAYGSSDEKSLFSGHEKSISSLFERVPTFHRDPVRQGEDFGKILIDNISSKSHDEISDRSKDILMKGLDDLPSRVGGILSRDTVMDLCQRNASKIFRKEIETISRLSNAAYYKNGARLYSASISIGNSHRFESLGRNLFKGGDIGSINLSYDPYFFLDVLRAHGITSADIDRLSYSQIKSIRMDNRFSVFVGEYRKFCTLVQDKLMGKSNDLSTIQRVLISHIVDKYTIENKSKKDTMTDYLFLGEVSLSYVLLGLSLAMGSGTGASLISGAMAFIPSTLQRAGFPIVENIIKAVNPQNGRVGAFSSYIDYLREIVETHHLHSDQG